MNKIIYYVSITLLTVVSSCGNKETNVSRKLTLDNCPVIAQVINLQGDPVTDLDFSSVKDTFNLPLSSLLSSFQVIRLENSEDALTAAGQDTHIAVSDHYILVKSFRAGSSCKLYNRNGDFIRKISSQGQGPDEYNLSIYDQYLDEYVYSKIWAELSSKDKEILSVISESGYQSVKDIREKLDMKPELFSVYRDRLKRKGVIDTRQYGKIAMALPRFEEYVKNRLY